MQSAAPFYKLKTLEDVDMTTGRPFKKGQSGNPSGKPKSDKTADKLPSRKYAKTCAQRQTKDILDTWTSIMMDPKQASKDRIVAAQMLWYAAWGKPGISRDEQSETENALSNLPQVVLATVKQRDSDDDESDD